MQQNTSITNKSYCIGLYSLLLIENKQKKTAQV